MVQLLHRHLELCPNQRDAPNGVVSEAADGRAIGSTPRACKQTGEIGRAGEIIASAALNSQRLHLARQLQTDIAGINLGHRRIVFAAKPLIGGGFELL